MIEIKHTPAPWHTSDSRYDRFIYANETVHGNPHKGVAFVTCGVKEATDEIVANKHLIATSPELYAALANVLTEYDAEHIAPFYGSFVCRWCVGELPARDSLCQESTCPGNIARAALAKARGEELAQ